MLEHLKRWLPGTPASTVTTASVTDAPPAADATGTPPLTVIDVRSEREFDAAALAQAVNVPLPQLEQRIRALVPDPATPLALYCASGARSGMGCVLLEQMGYANVVNAGGLYAAAARLQREVR